MAQRTAEVAVVTGGGSGIGMAIAHRLAADGHAIGVVDLDGRSAVAAATGITDHGGRALGVDADVGDPGAVLHAMERIRTDLGIPTILVNNAGTGATFTRFTSTTSELWEQVVRVNLLGAVNCCQAVVPDMIAARWGRIVNISSSSTHGGQALLSHYVATKSALNGLTTSLALELGPLGITVNAIPPGFIDTPMLQASVARGEFGPGGIADAVARTPVRRAGRPEDVAAACSFLCRDEAAYITGQIFGVNGGRNT